MCITMVTLGSAIAHVAAHYGDEGNMGQCSLGTRSGWEGTNVLWHS